MRHNKEMIDMSPKDDNCYGTKCPEASGKVADDCKPTSNIANKDNTKKDTVAINEKDKSVLLSLNPRLYPQNAVMRASYRFIDDFDVIVDGDPLSTIFVTIKAKAEDDASRSELEDLVHAFFKELIHANVEETQARRYADTRNALIGASLRSMMPSIASKEKEVGTHKEEKKTTKSNTS